MNCPLCGDTLTPCYITLSKEGHVAECHGMDKDWIGTSVNRTPVQPHVCAGCGYVAMFATDPTVFRNEANRSRGPLPIPTVRALPPIDRSLPVATEDQETLEEVLKRE